MGPVVVKWNLTTSRSFASGKHELLPFSYHGPKMSGGETGKDRNLANNSLSSLPGLYNKPFLSTDGGHVVMPGENISFQCSSAYMSFDRFSLSRPGGATLSWHRDARLQGDFTLGPVNLSFSGVYTCYGWHSSHPYVWSAPSTALELVVTGKGTPPPPPLPETSVLLLKALAGCPGPWHQAGEQRGTKKEERGRRDLWLRGPQREKAFSPM